MLLRGLKHFVARDGLEELAAVVTVADDGGSSGRLRRDFGMLPPGDIRNCMAALADDEDLLTQLFQYRFSQGQGLMGHSFGNLFLTALTGVTGDFYQAIVEAEKILSVRGRILPATLGDLRLHARGASGRHYAGESAVGRAGEPLRELWLEPAAAEAFPEAVAALRRADLIVLGPGSLYTSVAPNLLIEGIREAVRTSDAAVALPLNLMTQPGETDGMSATDHLEALARLSGLARIDYVIVNSGQPPSRSLDLYLRAGAEPVPVEAAALQARDAEVVEEDLLADGSFIRHDPLKLARTVMALARRTRADLQTAAS